MMSINKIWEFDSNIIKLKGNDLTVYSTIDFDDFKEKFGHVLNRKSFTTILKILKKLFKKTKVTQKKLDESARDLFLDLFVEIENAHNLSSNFKKLYALN